MNWPLRPEGRFPKLHFGPPLTPCEAQALLDAIDTMNGHGLEPITADLEVYNDAVIKLKRYLKEHPCE